MDESEFKKRTQGKVFTRTDEAGRQVVGLDLGLQGRHMSRLRRCQNCSHWDTDEAFDAHFNACAVKDGKVLRDQGATSEAISRHGRKLRLAILEKRGLVGYCTARIVRGDDAAGADFTSAGYLCDTWSGAHGIRFGPELGPIDKLPAEILDDLGEPPPVQETAPATDSEDPE